MPVPHDRFTRFYDVLKAWNLFTPWTGDVARAAEPRWISRPYRFTGAGSLLVGARWNIPRLFPAVYFSNDLDTLSAEADAWARRHQLPLAKVPPQTRFTAAVNLQAVLNLTLPSVLAELGLTTDQLIACDWRAEQSSGSEALTQAVGRAAFEHLAEGLIVPSAPRPGGVNLVYFPGHRRDGSSIETYFEDGLPLLHGIDQPVLPRGMDY